MPWLAYNADRQGRRYVMDIKRIKKALLDKLKAPVDDKKFVYFQGIGIGIAICIIAFLPNRGAMRESQSQSFEKAAKAVASGDWEGAKAGLQEYWNKVNYPHEDSDVVIVETPAQKFWKAITATPDASEDAGMAGFSSLSQEARSVFPRPAAWF